MAYDLAAYINECICDNNALGKIQGVQGYPNNLPSKTEFNSIATQYLRLYYSQIKNPTGTESDLQDYLKERVPSFIKEIESCVVLNGFFWTVWSFMLLKPEDELDMSGFHWEFCRIKASQFKTHCEKFGIDATV